MRNIYGERMSVLKDAADRELAGLLDVRNAASGMRTMAWLNTRISDVTAAERARMLGLEVLHLSAFSIEHRHKPALVLGFAGCNPGELRRGVSVLARAPELDSH
jgi:GntR family transcriptional regulator/MocR family aminotransferase